MPMLSGRRKCDGSVDPRLCAILVGVGNVPDCTMDLEEEMKATLTCERCGYELFSRDRVKRLCDDGRSEALYIENCVESDQCPNCGQSTYGR